jgi:hypothetical protein
MNLISGVARNCWVKLFWEVGNYASVFISRKSVDNYSISGYAIEFDIILMTLTWIEDNVRKIFSISSFLNVTSDRHL